MVIVPSTNIILLKTPMELSDNNQLTWSTKQEQYNYFNSLPKLMLEDATYQRKEGVIRYPTTPAIPYEELLKYNYCMYQNDAYDDKWFYAYITEVNYINDGMSTIKIETDVWNTWCFDITFKNSFIEREHVNDDTIGLHTVPENVEKGEYICSYDWNFQYKRGESSHVFYPCVGVSENIFTNNQIKVYNGVYSGLQYICLEDSDSLAGFLNYYSSEGKVEEVYTLFMIPECFISNTASPNWSTRTISVSSGTWTIKYIEVPSSEIEFNCGTTYTVRPTQLGIGNNKYTPKNKKLLTSDYIYILVDNMCGSVAKYDYEYFSNPNNCVFQTYGAINSGCSIKVIPKNYKGVENNYSEGLTGAKLPVCSWVSDIYTNWLTQNGINIGVNMVMGAMNTTIGVMKASSGDISGVTQATSGASTIANTISEVRQHYLVPAQAQGNTNVGDVMFAIGVISPTLYDMTIKPEFAKIIDDYFSMYGYKVNSVKTPNIRGRRNWNYVKTIGCNLIGDIPQLDLQKIKNMFDTGITLWHNSSTFLDYSQDNSII